jgi:hypothetical protein
MRREGGTGASTCYWMCLFHCTNPGHVDTCKNQASTVSFEYIMYYVAVLLHF